MILKDTLIFTLGLNDLLQHGISEEKYFCLVANLDKVLLFHHQTMLLEVVQ